MNNILKALAITAFMMIVLPFIGNFNNVYAIDESYNVACNIYSVDYINDNGLFENIGCYDDYASAKNKMKENKDYVVRHASAYSPSKIVAMNSGLVYSYPRGSSKAIDLYSNYSNKKQTTTYVDRYYEMTYVDTPFMSVKPEFIGTGYTQVVINGFNGYADTEYCDLVPSKFIDNGLSIYVGGSYGGNSVEPKAVKFSKNYYIIQKNGNYYDLEYHFHYSYPDQNGNASEYKIKVDNAQNYTFMSANTKYYSDDGINFYSDYKLTNFVGKCYNYYQFLPIRTKSKITSNSLDGFLKYMRNDYASSAINAKGSSFVSIGDEYGCNHALFYAFACQEAAYGTSGYAVNRNNLFGWNAFDDSPDDASYFSSIETCLKEQMGRNIRKYADVTDGRYNGTYFGSKGSGFNLKYASDPYWGMKIAAIYYNLDKYSNNNNGSLTDHNNYTLGVVNTFGAKIYSDSSCSNVLYTSNYTSYRQQDNIIVLLEQIGDVYKTQLANPISDGNLISNVDGVYGYSWSKSIGYIKCSDVDVLYGKNVKQADLSHDAINSISNVTLKDGILKISGIGAISNIDFTNSDDVTHTIKFVDFNNEENVISFDCTNIDTNGFSMNDGFDYKYAGFSAEIDLTNIDISSYYLMLETSVGSCLKTTTLRTTELDFLSLVSSKDDITYKFSANQTYAYRTEIDIVKTGLDYSIIKKPAKRKSLCQFNSLKINDDATINFSGYAMIYYLNYASSSSNRYSLYLVNESTGANYTIALDNIETINEIKNQINTTYNIDFISFSKDIDLTNIDSGSYVVNLIINTSDNSINYIDYLEFNAEDRVMPSITYNDINYSFNINKVRNRLMLNIKEAE